MSPRPRDVPKEGCSSWCGASPIRLGGDGERPRRLPNEIGRGVGLQRTREQVSLSGILVIGEAARFPELGRTFYERGPERTIETLAAVFECLAERGALEVDDPRLAAAHFNWLAMSIPLNQAMLRGTDEPASRTNSTDTRTLACVRSFAPTRPGDRPIQPSGASSIAHRFRVARRLKFVD